jgi:HNH endonuclease
MRPVDIVQRPLPTLEGDALYGVASPASGHPLRQSGVRRFNALRVATFAPCVRQSPKLPESPNRHKRMTQLLTPGRKLELIQSLFALDANENLICRRPSRVIRSPDQLTTRRFVCTGYAEWDHRIRFALARGYLPAQIDHIDGNRANNFLANLRPAASQENSRNRPPPLRKEPSLPRGVYRYFTKDGREHFRVRLWERDQDGKRRTYHFGVFDTLAEARAVSKRERMARHGDFYRHTPARPTTPRKPSQFAKG